MPDIRLPDGQVIKNVPEGTTKTQLLAKLQRNNVITGQEDFARDFLQPQTQQEPEIQQEQVQSAQEPTFGRSPEEQATFERFAGVRRQIAREPGLAARAALQGVSAPVTLIPDLATLGINAVAGTDLKPLSSVVSEGLTAVGLPTPETAGERIATTAGEVATGAGALAKGVQAIAGAPRFIQGLGRQPVAQTVGGAGAGAAVATGEEVADIKNPLAQLALGVAGGAAGTRLGTTRAVSRIAGQPRPEQSLLSDVAERGLDETTAISNLRAGLQTQAKKDSTKVTNLFEAAKERGKNAFIDKKELNSFSNKLRQSARNEIDREGKELINDTADVIDDIALGRQLEINNINELQSLRRSATRVSAGTSPKKGAAGRLVKEIDEFFETAKIKGDKEAANLWKSAIKNSREFFRKFQDPIKVARAVDEAETVETVEQAFLGGGSVATQRDVAKTYNEVLKAMPAAKRAETGFAMRQSALNKMIKDAARASDSPDGLSASRLSNSIKNLRRENQSFWNKFNKSEKETLTQLEKELRKTAEGGAVNKTYSAIEKIVSKGLRSNVELPRTLKAKTIVDINDLLELSRVRPKSVAALIAVDQSQNNN